MVNLYADRYLLDDMHLLLKSLNSQRGSPVRDARCQKKAIDRTTVLHPPQRAHTHNTDLCRAIECSEDRCPEKNQTSNSKNLAIEAEFCLQHGFQFHLFVIMNALIQHCDWSVVCNENMHIGQYRVGHRTISGLSVSS